MTLFGKCVIQNKPGLGKEHFIATREVAGIIRLANLEQKRGVNNILIINTSVADDKIMKHD